ncbi:VOC family protein [Streptomyces cavernicola]|uniref:VOC family protein n=1 Tax=Streptomyces cavernicola TaxID=3043613 RepID=A0ABT6S6J7_9ACTN|nr:VOC family protein [Streptomyces sp. B-S-A6]MDI3403693.1 VOC family protein [Streptomyces sp. B-S-A6]
MPADASAHLRIARPSRDLGAVERFWVSGLGLDVQYRHPADGTPGRHSLLMVGWPGAAWHLELVHDPAAPVEPRPTPEDLLVVYLDGPVPADLVERIERHGGRRVPAHNPYWDEWGVTLRDPDGYLLVLSTRNWGSGRHAVRPE